MELTWSSLAATKQELDNMKDLRQTLHQMQEVNQKLTESMADSREEVRNLTLAMKNLEMQNIQQRKWMEDTVRKMAREMKSLENKMVDVKAANNDEVTFIHRARSSILPTSVSRQRIRIAQELPKRQAVCSSELPMEEVVAEPRLGKTHPLRGSISDAPSYSK